MTVLWINLGIVYLFSLFSRYFGTKKLISGRYFVNPNKSFTIIALLSLVLVSGLRKNMADTFFYEKTYAETNFTWEVIKSQKDIGFNIFQMLLQNISHDPQILVFATALLTNVFIVLQLYKYCRFIEIGLFVYITNGMFLTSMNGIRQFFAAAIVFMATKYILNGDWRRYFVIIILAAQIHQSALILIPIYFIVRRKAWTGFTFALLGMAILIVLGFSQFNSTLFSVIGDTQYGEYNNLAAHGANIIRVFVEGLPVIFAYFGREKLREEFPNSDYIVNMSLLAVVFMIIATKNWIFARFNIYFDLYSLILISWVVKLFTYKEQRLIYYTILVFYFIFCFYQQQIVYGTMYQSNFIKI